MIQFYKKRWKKGSNFFRNAPAYAVMMGKKCRKKWKYVAWIGDCGTVCSPKKMQLWKKWGTLSSEFRPRANVVRKWTREIPRGANTWPLAAPDRRTRPACVETLNGGNCSQFLPCQMTCHAKTRALHADFPRRATLFPISFVLRPSSSIMGLYLVAQRTVSKLFCHVQ